MDFCSYFIPRVGLFGAYPNTQQLEKLRSLGVQVIVDLTFSCEIEPSERYSWDGQHIKFPIKDHSVPRNWGYFSALILYIEYLITNGSVVYIHCRGGHGRAGTVVACLLRKIYGCTAEEAILKTTQFHDARTEMREKWRTMGSPQTKNQRVLVERLFSPFYFSKAYKTGTKAGFSPFSKHSVNLPFGSFSTLEAAFLASKAPNNRLYIQKLQSQILTQRCLDIAQNQSVEDQLWLSRQEDVFYKLLEIKYDQHRELIPPLIQTGLRHIIDSTRYAIENNMTGQSLMKLRDSLSLQFFKDNFSRMETLQYFDSSSI